MCHEPDSRTLERYHLNAMPATDVVISALALGERVGNQDEMVLESSTLSLTALNRAKVVEIYGSVLNAAV